VQCSHTVEYAGLVDPRFWGVTCPNLHHIRPSTYFVRQVDLDERVVLHCVEVGIFTLITEEPISPIGAQSQVGPPDGGKRPPGLSFMTDAPLSGQFKSMQEELLKQGVFNDEERELINTIYADTRAGEVRAFALR